MRCKVSGTEHCIVLPESERRPPQVAKLYLRLRSAHLERQQQLPLSWLFYRHLQYDIDPELLARAEFVQRTGLWDAARNIRSQGVTVVEINEPAMVAAWPVIASFMTGRTLYRRSWHPSIVFYALENQDPRVAMVDKFRIPVKMAELLVERFVTQVAKRSTKVCFGTSAARELYRELIDPAIWSELEGRSIILEPLPAPMKVGRKSELGFVFLGELSNRKGLDQVLKAWPRVRLDLPGATLRILGNGPLAPLVEQMARRDQSIFFEGMVDRATVRSHLSDARILVLPSKTSARWREQVGLPLLEGLAYGCELVTSDATGIAETLMRNDHRVLASGYSDFDLAEAMVDAGQTARDPERIQSFLPKEDGRLAAERWLYR